MVVPLRHSMQIRKTKSWLKRSLISVRVCRKRRRPWTLKVKSSASSSGDGVVLKEDDVLRKTFELTKVSFQRKKTHWLHFLKNRFVMITTFYCQETHEIQSSYLPSFNFCAWLRSFRRLPWHVVMYLPIFLSLVCTCYHGEEGVFACENNRRSSIVLPCCMEWQHQWFKKCPRSATLH